MAKKLLVLSTFYSFWTSGRPLSSSTATSVLPLALCPLPLPFSSHHFRVVPHYLNTHFLKCSFSSGSCKISSWRYWNWRYPFVRQTRGFNRFDFSQSELTVTQSKKSSNNQQQGHGEKRTWRTNSNSEILPLFV